MNEEVKAILGESINLNNEIIPVAHLRYEGKSKKYITWTMLDENPALFANDEPLYGVGSVDIDIFSNGNYLDIIKEVKRLMKTNEWVWKGDSPEMYEDDTGLYHKTCTFEKERTILWQE